VRVVINCPEGVLKRSKGHILFEFRHRVANIISGRLDVVSRRGAHVRVTQNPLDHHLRYTQTVQIAPEAAPCRVPAMPFGDTAIPFEHVIGL